MNWQALEKDDAQFKIGSVSRLTGIPTDTLRIWERRYEVVTPGRGESGTRLYKHSDITRLALIKQLVDQGNAISTVANLSRDELEKRLKLTNRNPNSNQQNEVSDQICRLIICGDALPLFIRNNKQDLENLNIIAEYKSIFSAANDLEELDADILMMEFPNFQEENIGPLQSILKANPGFLPIVVYGFATRSALELLEKLGISTIRAPLDSYRLKGECHKVLSSSSQNSTFKDDNVLQNKVPKRRFTQQQLMKLNNMPATVNCECPRHHVDILYGLYAFEDYSLQCEINNKNDAALHSYMHAYTANARSLMEQSLQKLIDTEGFEID